MGDRITNPAGPTAAPLQQVGHSWDFAVYFGLKNGTRLPATAPLRTDDGGVIAPLPGDELARVSARSQMTQGLVQLVE